MSSPVLVMFKYKISLNVSLLFCLRAFFFFFRLHLTSCTILVLSSLIRDETLAHGSESTES